MKTFIAALLLTASPLFAGYATHFGVEAPPTFTAAVPFDVTVRALDASGAVDTGYSNVWIRLSAGGTSVATYTFLPSDGGVHTFTITLSDTCPIEVVAAEWLGIKGSTVVNPAVSGGARSLSLRADGVTALRPFSLALVPIDASGNPVDAGYFYKVRLTATCPILPEETWVQDGWAILKTSGAQTITATADVGRCHLSGNLTLDVGPALPTTVTHLSVKPGSSHYNVGASIGLTIAALNDADEVVPTYDGTVYVGNLCHYPQNPNRTFQPSDRGVLIASLHADYPYHGVWRVYDTSIPFIDGSTDLDVSCPELKIAMEASGPACAGRPATVKVWMPFIAAVATCDTPAGDHLNLPVMTSGSPYEIPAAVPGTYQCTAYGATFHCPASGRITVAAAPEIPAPEITVEPQLPARSSTNMASVLPVDGATYSWSITNGTIQWGAHDPQVFFTTHDPGPSVLSVTVQSSYGCSASATKTIDIQPRPTATIPETLSVCERGTITIPIALTGTPPFTLVWSDGTTQSGIGGHTAKRDVEVAAPAALSIVAIRDAVGGSSIGSGRVALLVDTPPAIGVQPLDAVVATGAPAAFTVTAGGQNLHYTWYFVPAEGPLMPVGGDAASFTTEWPVTKPETYVVRVWNACGSVESVHATARPSLLRRRVSGS